MSELRNSDQRRCVEIVLQMFEENLRDAETWLQGAKMEEFLYQHCLRLSPERRQAAQQRISTELG